MLGLCIAAASYVAPLASMTRSTPIRMDVSSTERRAELAADWIRSEGFYSPVKREMMSEDFVFMGPVVGPLNAQDYLGTLGVFKIYDAFPDVQVKLTRYRHLCHSHAPLCSPDIALCHSHAPLF